MQRPDPLPEATDTEIVAAVRYDAALVVAGNTANASHVLGIHGHRVIVTVQRSTLDAVEAL